MPQGSAESDRDELRTLPLFQRWRSHGDIARGRFSTYWLERLAVDATLKGVKLVAELVFGRNTVVRLAEKEVTYTSGKTGVEYVAQPGLVGEPTFAYDMTLGEGTSSARSVSFTVAADLIPINDMIGRGEMLAGFGELFLINDGGDYDQRKVLMRGDMDGGVGFGANKDLFDGKHPGKETIDISLSDPKITADTNLPPWILDDTRWEFIHDSAVGLRVPIIINGAEAVPCPYIVPKPFGVDDFYCVAYGGGVTLVQAYVDGVASALGTLTPLRDKLGLPVTSIAFNTGAGGDNVEVHCNVTMDNHGFNVIRAIEHLLVNFSQIGRAGLDQNLIAEAEGRLRESGNAVVSGVASRLSPKIVINEGGATALSYVEGTLLDEYPMVSMVWDGEGYGPVIMDQRASPTGDYEVGLLPFLDRATQVQEISKGEMLNSFLLRWDYDPIQNLYRQVAIRNASNSDLCRWSRDQIGERFEGERQSITIYDEGTASWVLDWLVEHFARTSYYVEYHALPLALWLLRRGDTIRWSDDEFAWSSERATVERIVYQQGRCTVGMRVWPSFLNRLTGAMQGFPPV